MRGFGGSILLCNSLVKLQMLGMLSEWKFILLLFVLQYPSLPLLEAKESENKCFPCGNWAGGIRNWCENYFFE